MQLCVADCIAGYGPIDTVATNACLGRMCDDGAAAQAPGLRGQWTTAVTPDGAGHAAGIRIGGRTLSFLCKPDAPSLVAVEGLGGSGLAMRFSVDGQPLEMEFSTQNGVHFGSIEEDSEILHALMVGSYVQVVAGQITASFPLAGSERAIRRAMTSCEQPETPEILQN